MDIHDDEYARLLEFRTGLRTFLKWSRSEAGRAGIAPSQHQLLLAIRGHRSDGDGPTIGEVADYLLIEPHSAGELVTRAAKAGLVERIGDGRDRRMVRLRLTRHGAQKLSELTAATLQELERLGSRLRSIWVGLDDAG